MCKSSKKTFDSNIIKFVPKFKPNRPNPFARSTTYIRAPIGF